jgi:2-polyprenyl-3-methyl-5-hydroxy-6-metoxy-1,4-benzoquinol methylase
MPSWSDLTEIVASCDLCGALMASAPRIPGMEDLPLRRCPQCGLVITTPRPPEHELSRWYPDNDGLPASSAPRWRPFVDRIKAYAGGYPSADGVMRRLVYRGAAVLLGRFLLGYLPHLGPGRRLLDVGCGTGAALRWALNHGWTGSGIETSAAAVQIARASGCEVLHGSLETVVLPPRSFDAITLTQVLEHTPSPTRTLRRCRELLAPGGIVVVAVPNFDSHFRRVMNDWWPSLELPRHLYHFTERTLTRLVHACGFEVREMRFRSRLTATLGNLTSLRRHLRAATTEDPAFRRADVLAAMARDLPQARRDARLRMSDNMLALLHVAGGDGASAVTH